MMSQLEKAVFFDPDASPRSYIRVQFNPNSLNYQYGKKMDQKQKSEWKRKHQQQSPLDSWASSNLSLRLFFNTYESETKYTDVREKIKPLRSFLCKTEDHSQVCSKKIQFAWGTFAFEGFLNSINVTFQMFGMDGTPVQAEVDLSISGEESDIANDVRQAQLKAAGLPSTGRANVEKKFSWLFS